MMMAIYLSSFICGGNKVIGKEKLILIIILLGIVIVSVLTGNFQLLVLDAIGLAWLYYLYSDRRN